MQREFTAAQRTLDRLAADPFDKRLGTISFETPELGFINGTPTREDAWYVIWQRTPGEPGAVDIILIQAFTVGQPAGA